MTKLKQILIKKKVMNKTLAEETGLSLDMIASLVQGRMKIERTAIASVVKIASALKVKVYEIIEDEEIAKYLRK